MKILVLINTYNRPDMLLQLLKDIFFMAGGHELSIRVYDDCSTENYGAALAYLRDNFTDAKFIRQLQNQGKSQYWKIINQMYQGAKPWQFDYLVHLPDDIRLAGGFFDAAIKQFAAIQDESKICLNLLTEYSRAGKACWTKFVPELKSFGEFHMWLSNWVDMCYIAKKEFLVALNFTVNPVALSWAGNKQKSSGVGKQISERLFNAGFHLYQVQKSLVAHGEHQSQMNPEIRKVQPLISNTPEKIIGGIASIAERVDSLKAAIDSILKQIDELHVYLDNYTHVPAFLKHPKIKYYFGCNCNKRAGDAGKFFTVSEHTGYYFSFDDDLVYPPDYVHTYISAIEKHNRKVIVTSHGRIYRNFPIASYYRSSRKLFKCLKAVERDTFVQIGGTGVMAFHTDTIKLRFSDFKKPNMADIWLSKKAKEQNIPILVLAHQGEWIIHSPIDTSNSIARRSRHNDHFQTKIVNSVDWGAEHINFSNLNFKKMIHIVIPYIHSDSGWDEIKFALRSWAKHFKDEFAVVIIGDLPNGIDPGAIRHIPFERLPNVELPNCCDANRKINAIILDNKISSDFIVAYDDIYLLDDLYSTWFDEPVAVYEFSDSFNADTAYRQLLQKTWHRLKPKHPAVYNFETHIPRLYNKQKLIEVYKKYRPIKNRLLYPTLYFNETLEFRDPILLDRDMIKASFHGAKGSPGVNYKYDFPPNANIDKACEGKMFLNHNNRGLSDKLKSWIENRFPDKCRFEL